MGSSFYVQIADYLLLEYTYGDSSTTYVSNQVKLARLTNEYTGEYQFLNTSAALNTTGNVLNTSAAKLDSNKWGYLNTDVPTPITNMDSKLTYRDLSTLLTSLSVTYDRVRVHILSGYRLEDLDGLIVQVYARESRTSLTSILANNVYLKSGDRDILNPKPIILGDKNYDRYIEVYVPSVKEINEDFFADTTNQLSIGYQYSSDNRGLLYESGIYVKVFEILSTATINGIVFFSTSDDYEVSINQEDLYSGLSATVREAEDGDYFEYFPSYNGNFIEDFIASLNGAGGDYAVINDIDVYEQIGSENLLTFSFSQLQTGGFDAPAEWRPIVKYANEDVSFSIDYTVRLLNRNDGFQLIRRSSTTSYNPRKYGKNLERISLASQSYPLKVYNKVVKGPDVTFESPAYDTSFNTVYIPVFYESQQVVTKTKTLLDPNTDIDLDAGVYYGQGDARIYLSDFDTYVKFNIYNVNKKTGAITKINLIRGDIFLVFKSKDEKNIYVELEPSIAQNARAQGELVFKVPGSVKRKALYDSLTKNFNIVLRSDGNESVIYSGTVESNTKVSEEATRIENVKTNSSTLTSLIGNIGATVTTSDVSNVANQTSKPNSLLSELTKNNSSTISSTDKNREFTKPYISGYSVDSGASSIRKIKPVSIDTKNKDLSQNTGTKINTKKT